MPAGAIMHPKLVYSELDDDVQIRANILGGFETYVSVVGTAT